MKALVLVIRDSGACGIYVKRGKVIDFFTVTPFQKLEKVIGKNMTTPLIICWDLKELYLLKKSAPKSKLLRLGMGQSQGLYIHDILIVETWLNILIRLKNPIKAMALIERSSTFSLQTPLYSDVLKFKFFQYWLGKGMGYVGHLFCLIAVVNLVTQGVLYEISKKDKEHKNQQLHQLETTYKVLLRQKKWTLDFCETIETLNTKLRGAHESN